MEETRREYIHARPPQHPPKRACITKVAWMANLGGHGKSRPMVADGEAVGFGSLGRTRCGQSFFCLITGRRSSGPKSGARKWTESEKAGSN